MDKIKDLDQVAYVRFASVYREFKDVNTFMDELGKLLTSNSVSYTHLDVYKRQEFDSWGRCFKTDSISWDFDEWMKRVVHEYLGKTGIYCNVFVANALRYAGRDVYKRQREGSEREPETLCLQAVELR